MYPQINKEQMPSAPPPYSESANAPKYEQQNFGPGYPANAGPSYPPPMGSQVPTQVIVVQAPALPPLGSRSVQVACPTCKSSVMTAVEEKSSNSAYLCCLFMFIAGCGLCSCVPFCMDGCKNYEHTCPRCNAFIGNYQPS